jgi:hypothetical protein
MALAQIAEINRLKLVQRSAELGGLLAKLFRVQSAADGRGASLSSCRGEDADTWTAKTTGNFQISTRALGLLAGIELRLPDGSPASSKAIDIIKKMLKQGYIVLPEGEYSNVISIAPPLIISAQELRKALEALFRELISANAS